MPPDQDEEQVDLLQEHGHQSLIQVAPSEEVSGLATDSSAQSNPRKHGHPEEPQSDRNTKCSKLSSDSVVPGVKSVTLKMNEYLELTEGHEVLRQELTETTLKVNQLEEYIEARDKDYESIKVELTAAKHALNDSRQSSTIDMESLKTEKENLAQACDENTADLATMGQSMAEERDKHEATRLLLAKLRDEAETSSKVVEGYHCRLRDMDQSVQVGREAHRNLMHELQSVKKQLTDTELDHESAKRQVQDLTNSVATAEEQLRCESNKREDATSRLEKAQEEIEALRIINDANGAQNMNIRDRLEKSKAAASEARKGRTSDKAKHQREKASLQDQVKNIQKELSTKENEWNELQSRLLKRLQDTRGQGHRYNDKITDEQANGDLDLLRFKIDQFIQDYLQPLPDAVDQKIDPTWEKLAPSARMFLESGALHCQIVEAYIWDWLNYTVFDAESSLWGGRMGTLFSKVVGMAESKTTGPDDELYVEYQHWRSCSASFITRLNGEWDFTELCRPGVPAMIKELSKVCSPFDAQMAETAIMEIVGDARRLDTTLRMQKAKFSWVFGRPTSNERPNSRFGFHFEDSSMVDVFRRPVNAAVNQQPTVDLVVTPALYKRGNNDGAEYQTRSCCIKMQVVCNASMVFPRSNVPANTNTGISGGLEKGAHTSEEASNNHTPRLSSYMFPGLAPTNRTQHGVISLPTIPTEGQLRRSTRATASENRPPVSPAESVYMEQLRHEFTSEESVMPEPGVFGGNTRGKRKSRHDKSDDEMDKEWKP